MGLVYANIELVNAWQQEAAKKHLIDKDEVRRMHTTVLVDSGATEMAINEVIQEIMQFPVADKRRIRLADESIITCDVVNCVEIRFENRICMTQAVVLPDDTEPLLGAIPMEAMDVIIHPKRQELIIHPEHPEGAVSQLRSIFPYRGE
ncbi:hypothetical protein HHL16_04585 [Pseudoflavitalea sp. G-6-1-2]|uniref:aspartyl protease family protein n=1 Tax=Pseudoflavitalea sp. G-6-1-2 TaxID=2728841 RepID=UPI00146E090A|nr:hypothetical protein [Pseudoflavitalea sp. G-6-1-2]NML20134.1 hypothetical protein [Pseudoflavitalea sp. G-6-1-2]